MVCYAKINVKMVEKMFIFYIGGAHSLNVRKYQWKYECDRHRIISKNDLKTHNHVLNLKSDNV